MMSGIKGLKYDSGAVKRKRKKVEESVVKSQKGALLRRSSYYCLLYTSPSPRD